MATLSGRTRAPVSLLLAVIAAEFGVGVLALSTTVSGHRSAVRPAAVVVDAAFTRPPTTAGIATVLNPGVAWAATQSAATPASTATPATTAPTTVGRPTPSPQPAVLTQSRITPTQPTPTTVAAANRSGWGCAAAFAWLSSHSAPGYRFVCPGYAEGHQAMTCYDTSACPGDKVIVIANPCPAAYMNEAHNSWIISGVAQGVIDPFGYCG